MEYSSKIERANDLMQMLGLIETMDQLALANSVRCQGNVLRREDGHILRMTLEFQVEGQCVQGRLKWRWKNQVEEEVTTVGLSRVDGSLTLPITVDCQC